jgi:hypothetical protein
MTLLCSHQILHQKKVNYKVENYSYYNVSYGMSMLIMSMVCWEMLTFWLNIKTFIVKTIENFRNKEAKALKLVDDNLENITKEEASIWRDKIKENLDLFEYKLGPSVTFFIKEIEEGKLNLVMAKYLKFILFSKMIVFEVLISSLQVLPGLQITSMYLIQTVVLISLVYAAVIKKVYSAWYLTIGDLFIEITLYLFLQLGFINYITGVTEKTVELKYIGYQKLMIYMILITTAILVVQIVIKLVMVCIDVAKSIRLQSRIKNAIKKNETAKINPEKSKWIKSEIEKIY